MEKLPNTLTARQVAIITGTNPETIREAIQNESFPFSLRYRGKGKYVYRVMTAPFLKQCGISDDEALELLEGKQ